MPLYEVKLSYPTTISVRNKSYFLFPGKKISLPDCKLVRNYVKLGYLKKIEKEKVKTQETKQEEKKEKNTRGLK